MGLEIEKKFLLDHKKWNQIEKPAGIYIKQGYIVNETGKNIRIRIADETAFITIKGKMVNFSKPEFEYKIPVNEAKQLLDLFVENTIEKIRYKIQFEGKIWEIDQFFGENEGLLMAEIELKEIEEKFSLPDWIGKEVTEDLRYYNSQLITNPYKNWK